MRLQDWLLLSVRGIWPYLLLTLDVIVIVFVITQLPWPIGPGPIYAGLALGALSVCAGSWTTVRYFRGKRDQAASLGPWLVLVGVVVIVVFIALQGLNPAVVQQFLDRESPGK